MLTAKQIVGVMALRRRVGLPSIREPGECHMSDPSRPTPSPGMDRTLLDDRETGSWTCPECGNICGRAVRACSGEGHAEPHATVSSPSLQADCYEAGEASPPPSDPRDAMVERIAKRLRLFRDRTIRRVGVGTSEYEAEGIIAEIEASLGPPLPTEPSDAAANAGITRFYTALDEAMPGTGVPASVFMSGVRALLVAQRREGR